MNFPVVGGRAFLYEQTAHHKPLTGSLNFPNNATSRKVWKIILDHVADPPDRLAAQVAQASEPLGVRYLVVHTDPMARPDMHDTAVRALRDVLPVLAEGDGVRVYRLW